MPPGYAAASRWNSTQRSQGPEIDERYLPWKQETFKSFLEKMCGLDKAKRIDQLRNWTNLRGELVPLIIELMMDHPDTLWGDACYPVVG